MVEEGILSKTTGNGKPVQSGKSVLPLNGKDMYIISRFLREGRGSPNKSFFDCN